MVHAACWAHTRRKYFDASMLNPKDMSAVAMVKSMDAQFAIDHEAREAAKDLDARHTLGLERVGPVVTLLREELVRFEKSTLPKSALGQATNYTLSVWKKPRLNRWKQSRN